MRRAARTRGVLVRTSYPRRPVWNRRRSVCGHRRPPPGTPGNHPRRARPRVTQRRDSEFPPSARHSGWWCLKGTSTPGCRWSALALVVFRRLVFFTEIAAQHSASLRQIATVRSRVFNLVEVLRRPQRASRPMRARGYLAGSASGSKGTSHSRPCARRHARRR